MSETAYRFKDRLKSCGVDEWDNSLGSYLDVEVLEFKVLRHTPKGFWIGLSSFSGDERFVRSEARKKFACLDLEEARASFIARKKRQQGILRARLQNAEKAEKMAERWTGTPLRMFRE